ncbi:MAG: hypothetical protein JXR31_00430 [Prolixibacteraceae bacterium]|nr:hypothetical protein [Prolixibacteraceae bacterium]MBN2772680.1 hypothetical protein [Prolixibacteraceae bacterium]
MKKRIIYILFIILPFILNGQGTGKPWQMISSASNSFKGKLSGKTYTIPYTPNGSHFYHSDFVPAEITLEDGEVFENIMVRYNSYLDELVCFNRNLNSLFTIDKFIVREFEVKSPYFGVQRFIKLESENFRNNERYFHVLYNGTFILLAYYKTENKKTGLYVDKTGTMKDSELVLKETYYILDKDSVLSRFLPKRKSFTELFPENKKQVKQILRKIKIYKYNAADLVKAFSALEEAGIIQ